MAEAGWRRKDRKAGAIGSAAETVGGEMCCRAEGSVYAAVAKTE